MDCVNLTCGFFLVRFYFNEDLDNVIQKGPWFIGKHFLSLRPWELFFKPSTANVSLIVVWIWLNKLPIELYETVMLRQIRDSIGKVLRIDSQTTMKARGELRHPDCFKAHGPNSRPSTLLGKTFPHSVKGKKAIARSLNLSPVPTNAAGPKLKGVLTHLLSTSPKLAHSSLNGTSQPSDATFEFTASPKAEMGHIAGRGGVDLKPMVAISNGRAIAGGGKEGSVLDTSTNFPEPIICEINPLESLSKKRMLEANPIATSIMGN
nr:hypothetical protein CFP56_15538 [Quercus suber]